MLKKKKPTNVKDRTYNMIPCVLFTHLFESHAVYRKYLERNTHPDRTDTLWDYSKERMTRGSPSVITPTGKRGQTQIRII